MSQTLSLEVWSDIACPWCYVGKRRLETALARFAQRDRVALSFHSFELDPAAPRTPGSDGPYAARLARKYGKSEAEAQAMIDRMVETSAREGIAMDFTRIRPSNTFDAHRLLHLAKARGLQAQLKERLFKGYFCEGAAMGEHEVLTRLATDVGLEADEVAGLLAGDLLRDSVRADQAEAKRLGIDSVPFFLIGRRYAVVGAQPPELLLQALETAWNELTTGHTPAV